MINNIIYSLINYGIFGIIVAAFVEPLFMPFPMEFVFIPISLANPTNSIYYALILIIFSAFGSIISYKIGLKAGRPILQKIASENTIGKIENLYDKNSFLTIMTSAFTPIPYEAYTYSAGLFKVNFIKFLIATTLSRVIRYIPEALLINTFGQKVIPAFKNYLFIVGMVILITIVFIKKLTHK